jgi:hypothetical protein
MPFQALRFPRNNCGNLEGKRIASSSVFFGVSKPATSLNVMFGFSFKTTSRDNQ